MGDPSAQPSGPRIVHFDGAKAVGMFLVFFGHTTERLGGEAADQLMKLTYSFHMPLFFFLAGIFAKPGSLPLTRLLTTKVKTRLLPVVFFTLVAIPLWVMSDSWEGTQSRFDDYLMGQPSLNWPTWFLVCLFSLEMIVGSIGRAVSLNSEKHLTIALAASAIIGLSTIHFIGEITAALRIPSTFWYIGEALIALPFYFLGARLKKALAGPSSMKANLTIFLISTITLLTTFQLNLGPFDRNPDVVMMVAGSHGNSIGFYLTACSGIFTILAVCRLIYRDNALTRFVGTNTLIYLGLAGISMHFIDGIALKSLNTEGWGLGYTALASTIYSLLIMSFLAPSVFAIRRWLPQAVGLRK